MKNQSGIVLLTTIMMIIIITMLVLSLMQSVFYYSKASSQVAKKYNQLIELETLAIKLITQNNEGHCISNDTDLNRPVKRLRNKNGCLLTSNGKNYYYLINELGFFPCLPITSNEKEYSSQHLLISIMEASQNTVLQLRVAKLGPVVECDLPNMHPIETGVISWRYLR